MVNYGRRRTSDSWKCVKQKSESKRGRIIITLKANYGVMSFLAYNRNDNNKIRKRFCLSSSSEKQKIRLKEFFCLFNCFSFRSTDWYGTLRLVVRNFRSRILLHPLLDLLERYRHRTAVHRGPALQRTSPFLRLARKRRRLPKTSCVYLSFVIYKIND